MNTTMETVSLAWVTLHEKETFKISINGLFSKKEAETAAATWREMFKSRPTKKNVVVCDCRYMIDYEPMARAVWQKALAELKPQIQSMWVISESKSILAGAAILGMFTSYKIRIASTPDQVTID